MRTRARVAGLPFVPFDAFEWVTRRLPGAVVTRGIEAMVAVIAQDVGAALRQAIRISSSKRPQVSAPV